MAKQSRHDTVGQSIVCLSGSSDITVNLDSVRVCGGGGGHFSFLARWHSSIY